MVNATPQPLYSWEGVPVPMATEVGSALKASLDRYGTEKISCSYSGSNRGPSNPHEVTILTMLTQHNLPCIKKIQVIYNKKFFSLTFCIRTPEEGKAL